MIRALLVSLLGALLAVPAAVGGSPPPQRFLLTLARDIHGHVPPHLVLVDRNGAVVRSIGSAGYALVVGKWSPDGRSIAWSDPAGVHVEDADGTNQRLLVPVVPGCDTACTQPWFVWEPDGTALDVGGAGRQTNEFLRVPLDGSPPSPWVKPVPWSIYGPSFWTPGGRSLVWGGSTGDTSKPGCCHFSVFETTPATHTTAVIFRRRNTQGQAPVWSPDATRWIGFAELPDPKADYGLRLVDRRTGKARLLGVTHATADVRWSPDGKELAVVLTDRRVITLDVASGRIHRIGPGGQLFYGRDGTLYVTRATDSELWESRDDGPERFVLRAPGGLEIESLDAD